MDNRKSVLFLSKWHDSRLHMGVAKYAKEANWHLVLDPLFEKYLPWGWTGDGCLLNVYGREYLDYAESLDMPIINMSANAVISSAVNVVEDCRAFGRMAARHLLAQGFRHFATFKTDHLPIARMRVQGFEEVIREHGESLQSLYYPTREPGGGGTWQDQKAWLAKALATLPVPTAVFCVDDRLAVKVVEAAVDANRTVPEELAVMGCGNLEIACECAAVPITSIDADPATQAYRAAQILDERMKGHEVGTLEPFQPLAVIQRKSTDTLAAEDPLARDAIRFILANYPSDFGVNEIATRLDIPRRKLNDVFKKEFGKGPAKILEQIRLKKAEDPLLNSGDTLDRIAQLTGFGSYLRLIRAFKRHYGMTPGEYRSEGKRRPAQAAWDDPSGNSEVRFGSPGKAE